MVKTVLKTTNNQMLVAAFAAMSLLVAGAGGVYAAEADLAKGEKDFKKICSKCHTVSAAELKKKKQGPALHGVFGRTAGTVEGFRRFSKAIKASGVVWDEETMDKWLTKPRKFIPKSKMPWGGWRKAERRANVIAYLMEATK